MRRAAAMLAVALAGPITPVQAADRSLTTMEGGVVCFSPYKLSEGIAAANRGDDAWMREAGCLRLKGGIPAVLIGPPDKPLDDWWQVRVIPKDAPAATVWGYAQSFRDSSGKQFPPPKWARGR